MALAGPFLDAAVIAELRKLDGPPRMASIRTALGCSVSELAELVQRLRWAGKVQFGALALSPSMRDEGPANRAAAVPAADEAGAADARCIAAAPAVRSEAASEPSDDHPTGAELVAQLRRAAGDASKTLHDFVSPFVSNRYTWIAQLKRAERPKAKTIEKVRAMCSGTAAASPDPRRRRLPAETYARREDRAQAGLPPSRRAVVEERSLERVQADREKLNGKAALADEARDTRRPGETLADAVRREAREATARREAARKPSGGRQSLASHEAATERAEGLADRFRRCGRELAAEAAPVASARKRSFEPLPEASWQKVSALAVELGEPKMVVLARVVEAGILCLREDLREGLA